MCVHPCPSVSPIPLNRSVSIPLNLRVSWKLLLSSSTYFVFLVAIFLLYWPLARVRAVALAVILLANYFFYAKWDLHYLALIPAASTCDFLFGLGLQSSKSSWVRRLLVTASIVMNIGLLAVLRYLPTHTLILPLTLSFYVFQALTYTIDIYRGDAKGTKSYLAHLAAVSFFPTTLAGPITRVSSLVDQFEKRKPLDPADGSRALFLIGMGLMKKLLIADYLSSNLVNRVFDFPTLYTGAETLIAVYPTPCKSTTTFPATPTSPSAPRCCSASSCHPISTAPTPLKTSPISGAAGTSRYQIGCAIICISRSPASARKSSPM